MPFVVAVEYVSVEFSEKKFGIANFFGFGF